MLSSRVSSPRSAPCCCSPLREVRADNISWTYNWYPGSGSPPGALNIYANGGNTGGFVQFSDEPGGTAINTSNVVATNLRMFSVASPGSPDTFSPTTGNWSLTLGITDVHVRPVGLADLHRPAQRQLLGQ